MTDRNLLERAAAAMSNSYSPYSRFPVGAAIECSDGSVFTGCNVENCALGCTMCAERVAVGNAVSAGHTDFVRLAITAESSNYCFPCGTCRQMLFEFAPGLRVLGARGDGQWREASLRELLPLAFGPQAMEGK